MPRIPLSDCVLLLLVGLDQRSPSISQPCYRPECLHHHDVTHSLHIHLYFLESDDWLGLGLGLQVGLARARRVPGPAPSHNKFCEVCVFLQCFCVPRVYAASVGCLHLFFFSKPRSLVSAIFFFARGPTPHAAYLTHCCRNFFLPFPCGTTWQTPGSS